jgi:hypothetical protein
MNAKSSIELRELTAEEMTAVSGGLRGDRIVIQGCIPPFFPVPPGTVVWNPWINPFPPIVF